MTSKASRACRLPRAEKRGRPYEQQRGAGRVTILLFVMGLLLCYMDLAFCRTLYPGQWAQVDPAERQWFREQAVPAGPQKGMSCCTEADGTYAEEDIRGNAYWARFEYRTWNSAIGNYAPAQSEWMRVPDDAVIHSPNRHGAPVVWWYTSENMVKIRCYSPGAGG